LIPLKRHKRALFNPQPQKRATGQIFIRGKRIGLFGGSFNPAHEGHLHISSEALKKLNVDEIWWLISPQNPLKTVEGMASFETRMETARNLCKHPALKVSDYEKHAKTYYTVDTIKNLLKQYPHNRFVWIMGADNLKYFIRWYQWKEIFKLLPIAIFDRQPYAGSACSTIPLQRFKRWRVPERASTKLVFYRSPAWVFLHCRLHNASASAIRKKYNHNLF